MLERVHRFTTIVHQRDAKRPLLEFHFYDATDVGFIIGDGVLRYGPEEIVEAFYNLQVRKGIVIGFDLQGVNHPAYNRDRGPAAIAGVRAHFEY